MFSLQIGREESIVHEWLDVCVTKAGLTKFLNTKSDTKK
jgi:hypothetical protein